MELNFTDILDSIDINKDEIANDRIMMNELIIDDIMIGLGYNKKKDKSVKRIMTGLIDWSVSDGETNRLAVRAYALEEKLDEQMQKLTVPFCKNNKYLVLLFTNGVQYDIFKLTDDEYVDVASFNIKDTISDDYINIMSAISKDGFNLEELDSYNENTESTPVDIKQAIMDRKEDVADIIASNLNLDKDAVIDFIENIMSSEQNVSIDTDRIDELEKIISDKQNQIDANKEKLESIDKFEQTINELNSTIELRDSEIDNLKEQLEGSGNTEAIQSTEELINKEAKINELQNLLDTKEANLLDANRTIVELKEEIENIKSDSSKTDTDIINSYIKQIQDLTNQLGQEKDMTKQLSADVKELEEKLASMTGVERQKAKELLDVIEDDPTQDRQYVAVINTELMQYDELNKFIGQVLQKLFEIKKLEASQFIFDGDLFKLIPEAERRDVVLGNKSYDLELDNMNETDALNKLRVLFSHFDDIVFECKKIGRSKNEDDNEVKIEENEVKVEETNDTEDILEEVSEDTKANDGYLTVVQMATVDEFLYTDDDLELLNIPYIGDNSITFNINKDRDEMTLEHMVAKAIDAGLSIAESSGKTDVVQLIKQTDLSNANDAFHLYTEEFKGCTRINGTKFVIQGLKDIKQATQAIIDVFKALDIFTDELFIYYDVKSDSETIKLYAFEEDIIQLRSDPFFTPSDEISKALAVIKGDLFNKITLTMKSLQAHRDIIKKSLAVKTRYLEKKISNYDDIVEVAETMLMEAAKQNIKVVYPAFSNVMGSTTVRLLSDNPSDVGDEPVELNVMGTQVYMAKLEDWQIIASLIKMHNTIFNDSSIAVQCILDDNALTYYVNEFNTSEPSLSLAVKSFAMYANKSVKKRG